MKRESVQRWLDKRGSKLNSQKLESGKVNREKIWRLHVNKISIKSFTENCYNGLEGSVVKSRLERIYLSELVPHQLSVIGWNLRAYGLPPHSWHPTLETMNTSVITAPKALPGGQLAGPTL